MPGYVSRFLFKASESEAVTNLFTGDLIFQQTRTGGLVVYYLQPVIGIRDRYAVVSGEICLLVNISRIAREINQLLVLTSGGLNSLLDLVKASSNSTRHGKLDVTNWT